MASNNNNKKEVALGSLLEARGHLLSAFDAYSIFNTPYALMEISETFFNIRIHLRNEIYSIGG